jgi:hypothetical protein
MRPVTVACPGVLTDRVRVHCADIAATARHVRIDPDARIAAGGISGLDETLHFLEGPPEAVARYVLILDTINFGSGWFGELELTTDGLTKRLTDHARAERPWTSGQLSALDAPAVGAVLGMPAEHQLTRLYAAALNHLGGFLGHRPMDKVLGDSAEDLAERLAGGMPFFDDVGFYKRAQIAANDLHLSGVVAYPDIDRLTIFADNLVPHVLRLDGVLRYSDELALRIDKGLVLTAGGEFERELRACAVHACEGLARELGVAPRLLDNWLWNRGTRPPYSERRAHVAHTVYY